MKLETMELRLSELNSSLEKERKEKENISRRLQTCEEILSRSRSVVGELRQKNESYFQLLEAKERELCLLQRLLKTEEDGKAELKAMIQRKKEKIAKLRASLQQREAEINRARQEAQSTRGELQLVSTKLEKKIFQVQELEQSKKELKDDLDRERRRIDNLVILAMVATDKNAYSREIKVGVLVMKSGLQCI